MPWVTSNFEDTKKIASTIEDNEILKSHLTFGAEYDSILEWFIESGAKTFDEIVDDSTEWGNFWNTENSPRAVVETGSRKEWCTNNICDFAGNKDEWTQEQFGSLRRVIRGGDYCNSGNVIPVAYRYSNDLNSDNYVHDGHGFRAALCIK